MYTVGTGSIALGGVAVDTAGDIFVTQNMSPGAVVVLFPNGTTKAVYTNAGYTNFTPPLEVAVDFTGQIVILDNTGRVFFLYPNGMQRVVYTSTSTYMLDFPYGVAVDGAGSAYVVAAIVNFNPIQAGVQVVNSSGALTAAYTNNGGFISPVAVAVDSVGNIHVVDNGLNQVVVLSSSGAQKQIIKPVDNFLQPSGIAIDSAGNIFVVDQGNGRVVVFYADGTPAADHQRPGFFSACRHRCRPPGQPVHHRWRTCAAGESRHTHVLPALCVYRGWHPLPGWRGGGEQYGLHLCHVNYAVNLFAGGGAVPQRHCGRYIQERFRFSL